MNAIKELCFAKINLYLDVISREQSGFHSVKSLMHTVSLADEVLVSRAKGTGSVRLLMKGESFLPTDERNLCVRAARAYMNALGLADDINITLVKNIPVAAGLAGGSADAAGVLRAMNKLYSRALTKGAMLKLAATLGSDIPFCLVGGTAVSTGRGEVLSPVADISLHSVVSIGNERVSTPEAYSLLDGAYSGFSQGVEHGSGEAISWIDSGCKGELSPSYLYNIFESVILPRSPGASYIKERLLSLGARASLMSGSGPSVFGIFDTEDSARAAAKLLTDEGYFAVYARSAR